MRRITILAAAAVTAAALAATVSSSWADGGYGHSRMHHGSTSHGQREVAKAVADLRFALAPYATNLDAAKHGGYSRQITPMMEDMGYHYMDPTVAGFDPKRPPILVYIRKGDANQLVAVEWVFPSRPAKAPLPGARYGAFPAACHFVDGTFVPEASQDQCPKANPQSGSAFSFWHPDL